MRYVLTRAGCGHMRWYFFGEPYYFPPCRGCWNEGGATLLPSREERWTMAWGNW